MSSLPLADFTGGLWLPGEAPSPTTVQPTSALPQNALREADNLDYLDAGGVMGRRGSLQANAATVRPGAIQHIRRFVQQDHGGATYGPLVLGLPAYDSNLTGTVEWTNVTAIDAGNQAGITMTAGLTSHFLVKRANFHLVGIPPNATITGLTVFVAGVRQGFANHPFSDAKVLLVNAGGVIAGQTANGRATGVPFIGDIILAQVLTYGGAADLWDIALTPGLITDPNFGVGFSVTIPATPEANPLLVGPILLQVSYTVPNVALTVVASLSGGNIVYELLDVGTGIFTSIASGTLPAPTRRPRSVFWPEKQKLFLFDGNNAVRTYDGTTLAILADSLDPASEILPPLGPYVALHQGRLYVTAPGEEQFSVYACEVEREDIWLGRSQISVNDEAGGRIRGLASYNGQLIVLKDTSCWRMLGDILFPTEVRQYSRVGCVSPDTVEVTPRGVIFLARDGLKLTDGQTVGDLSQPLWGLFVGRTADTVYSDAVGVWFPRREQYWLQLDPANDSTTYVLQLVHGAQGDHFAWSRIPSCPMNCAEVFELGTDDGDLYLGDRSGFVTQRDIGTADDGASYETKLVTYDFTLDQRYRRLGRAYQLRPYYRGAAKCSLALRYDSALNDQNTFLCGAALAAPAYQSPRIFVADQLLFGRTLALRASSNEGPLWELHRVDVDLRMRSRHRWPA